LLKRRLGEGLPDRIVFFQKEEAMSDLSEPSAMRRMFARRTSIEQVEEGAELAPKFDAEGLIVCVTTDAANGDVLMVGTMNAEALSRTIATGEAHYWSRRVAMWVIARVSTGTCRWRSSVSMVPHWCLLSQRKLLTQWLSMAVRRTRQSCDAVFLAVRIG
jgi:phosphoribosyl-AMP cyclohydrolase